MSTKKPLLFLALAASIFSFTALPGEAKRIVIEQPVVVSPGYVYPGYSSYNDYSYDYGPQYYYYGDRPFNPGRFTGHAVGGALNFSKHAIFDWF